MTIKLIRDIARRAADKDGLSHADRAAIMKKYGKKISEPWLNEAFSYVKDLKITTDERNALRWMFSL